MPEAAKVQNSNNKPMEESAMPATRSPRLLARRRLLKSLTVGGGMATAVKAVPEVWRRPVIDSVILPVHAQTSGYTCAIPFSFSFSAASNTPAIANTYDGTQQAAGPFTGDCNKVGGLGFVQSPLQIVVSDAGGGNYNVQYNVGGGNIWTRNLPIQVGVEAKILVVRKTSFGGFPALEEATYALTVDLPGTGASISGQANGLLHVNEAAKFGP